ncbi:MAG: ABC transporter ATP-binding protein [Clostridia bacterium]|nr:ABC transporter ATP-binding protein [Clostridia bacterium]
MSKQKLNGGILRRLGGYLWKFKWFLMLAILLAVVSNVLALVAPDLSGQAIDAADINNPANGGQVQFDIIFRMAALMAICYLVSAILSYSLQLVMIHIARKVTFRLRQDLFERLADLPVGFYDSHAPGDILSRISYDADNISQTLASDVVHVFTAVVTIVGSLYMMFRISPPLLLVFTVTIPLAVLLTRFITKRTRPLFRQRSKKLGELNDFVEEKISGQKTLKSYNQEENVLVDFDEEDETVVEAYYKAEYYGSTMGPSMNLNTNLSLALVSILGAAIYIVGGPAAITIGSISSFVLYSRKFSGPIHEIANIFSELQSALAAAERIFGLMDELPEPADPDTAAPIETVQGEVTLENVEFGYTPEKTILHNFSLKAEPGTTVAIVGPTGAGKSTLINLLMRFYDIEKGAIAMDGTNITDITRSSLRLAYSMVLQETWLFYGTIYDNIAFGRPDATREEVIAAAKAAGIHSFINALPDGYDTILTDDAANISKGQKQLLTIARAMLMDCSMLILDEATSNVDTRTEKLVQKAMRKLMQDKTCFVVAHRLSTIRDADQILVVRDGKIVGCGTHDSLMAEGGFYRELYNAQFE